MIRQRLEGIVTPVVTPLTPEQKLDSAALGRLFDFLLGHGIAAVFVLGTTGEGPALSRRLREETVAVSAELLAGRAPLLAGISASSLDDALELGRFAARQGANGVVAAPCCYLRNDEAELLDFYRILGAELPLPVYVYNMPATTKIDMPPELIVKIAGLPGIAGYKDSAGNFEAFSEVVSRLKHRTDFSLLMGPDARLRDALRIGAHGGVNSGSNLMPQLFTGMFRAVREDDEAEQLRLQRQIELLHDLYLFRSDRSSGVIAGLKAGLCELGICGVTAARPARPLEAEAVSAVRDILRQLKLRKEHHEQHCRI